MNKAKASFHAASLAPLDPAGKKRRGQAQRVREVPFSFIFGHLACQWLRKGVTSRGYINQVDRDSSGGARFSRYSGWSTDFSVALLVWTGLEGQPG
jgi:hypothetical protein